MLYTIIYDFMWKDLRLRGAEKEVFAVIYGFWKKGKATIEIPIQTVMAITGLSRTSVILAKRSLIARKLIAAHEVSGKPSRYVVLIPDPCENKTGTESERKNYKTNSYERNKSNCISSCEEFDTPDKE